MHHSRSEIPTDAEMDRAYTQWEREQKAIHPERPSVEFTKQYYPQAVVEAAWSECE